MGNQENYVQTAVVCDAKSAILLLVKKIPLQI